jgi:phospholipid/cholesterol/gamma-HCH transport system substrate-binding protein
MTRILRALVVLLASALLLTGCEFSVYKVPLPGGADTGDDPIQVKAQFRDVLDLVPQSTVKMNDVTVGKVTDVSLDGWTAMVTMELRRDTELPDNARAELRQTSLLGEKFVSLETPESGPSANLLGNGDVIPLDRTGRNPEVEEVLGALSLLLNGGGVAQLKTIAHELNVALEGREGTAKSVLQQIRTLMAQLDEGKGDIVAALESLNRLSKTANGQMDTIDAALEELPSALDTIDQQRDDLVRMLQALNRLSDVGTRVIRASKASTIDALQQLNPVLTQLAAAGDDFVKAFQVFLTYPFVDEVVGRDPQVARNLHMGDYTNLSLTMEVHVPGLDELPEAPVQEVCQTVEDVMAGLPDNPTLGQVIDAIERARDDLCRGAERALNQCLDDPDPEAVASCLEDVLGDGIRDVTGNVVDSVCRNDRLGLPLCDTGGGGGGGGGGDGGLLGDGPLGLGRAPVGAPDPAEGPTMGQLARSYDPALVSLLVPGMVMDR